MSPSIAQAPAADTQAEVAQAERESGETKAASMKFSFREQEWLDVLDWFARQADLSLVVNEVPPGSFTYSDTRAYTPTEALDLLNGVLSTRGFALIRHDRILVCANIKEGLPEGLIPRIDLEQLDEYGQFELVEVLFPLGKRPVEAVAGEITPLLGPHGKATALPQTKQLLVTTTAGKMRAVNVIISSIPEPPPPKPKPPKPPAPTLVVYPAKDVDPQAAVEMLKVMLSNATMTIDTRTGQINALATVPEHAVIAKLLAQMATASDQELEPKLQIYEIEHESPDLLLSQLRLVVPSAMLTYEPSTNRMIAFATPPDHKSLEETIKQLEAGSTDTLPHVPVVYSLRQVQPSTVQTMVQAMFPRAKVSVDAGSQRLVVLASLQQQTAIRQFIEQLENQPAGQVSIKDYPLNDLDPTRVQQTVQSIVPEAKLTVEPDTKRLLVVATEPQQTRVQDLLRQLEETAAPPVQRHVQAYEVTAEQRGQFTKNYTQLDPRLSDIKVLDAGVATRLLVLATDEQHQRLGELLDQVKTQFAVPEKRLQYYDVTIELRKKFTTLYKQLVPDLGEIRVLDDQADPRLGIVATDEQHRQVDLLLIELRNNLPTKSAQLKVFAVTPTERSRFLKLQSSLDPRLESVRIIDESRPQELVVWATAEQLQLVESLLKSLKDTGQANEMQLVAYPIESGDPESVRLVLSELYPDTKVLVDAESRRVMIWTTADQHAVIAQAIQQLDAPAAAGKRRMVYYRFGDIDAREVQGMFANLVPDMSLISDRRTNAIIAWGNDKDHELLAKTVEGFRRQAAEGDHSVVRYPCGTIDPGRATLLLRGLAPQARIVPDPATRAIIVWATEVDHNAIKKALNEVMRADDTSDATLKSYSLSRVAANEIVPLLKKIAPSAQIETADGGRQLLIWATAGPHRLLEQAIEQIETGDPEQSKASAVAYHSRADVLRQVETLLPEIAPRAKRLADDQADMLLVWTTPAQHEAIARMIHTLEEAMDEPDDQQVRIYPLGKTTPAIVTPLLDKKITEGISIIPDATRNALIVRASVDKHDALSAAIAAILRDLPEVRQRVSRVYHLKHANPTSLQTTLRTLVPTATLSIDSETRTLIAAAYEEDQELIATTVQQIDQPQTQQRQTRTYRIKFRNSYGVREAVQRLVPDAIVVTDRASRMMLVTASEPDHARIASVMQQMEQADADNRTTKVYRLKVADIDAAEDALRALLTDAEVDADSGTRSIIVTADAADQKRAETVIRQLDQDQTVDRQTRAYALQTGDVRAARDALQALLPNATIAADRENRTLLVTARAADQERVAAIMDQISKGQNAGRVTKVYRLQHADVTAAHTALASLLPQAVVAADVTNQAILVTATEDDQQRVLDAVEQLDHPNAHEPILQAYAMTHANVQSVYDAVSRMYANDPQVAITSDEANHSLLVKASVDNQRVVAQIVSRMENGAAFGQRRSLAVYAIDTRDAPATLASFQTLFKDQVPAVELSLNEQTRHLVAVATPEQHKLLAEATRQLHREPQRVEVFPLQVTDPMIVETAIARLYEDETSKPIANGDTESRQLFVRGTQSQLDEVRQLLMKMGELPDQDITSRQGVRVIPFRGNADDAVRQLQEIWPKLRANKIRVVQPNGSKPVLQRLAPPVEQLDAGDEDTDAIERQPSSSDSNRSGSSDIPDSDHSAHDHSAHDDSAVTRTSATRTLPITQTPPNDDDAPRETSRDPSRGTTPADPNAAVEPSAEVDSSAEIDPNELPPLIMIPSQGSITLLSDDEAALSQAEVLLRTLARQNQMTVGSGKFGIYSLRNAGARGVAKLMTDLFRQMPMATRVSMGRISLVADERLNAIVVHGRPADREMVAELLRVLDSSNVPDSLASARPEIVPIEYLEASRVLNILEGVYDSQLKSGGMRPEIEIPEGVAPEVATLLQQMNAAATSPLLTLEIDEATNSIVVFAPNQLRDEVAQLIKQLDENALQNDSRDISIVTLNETNVDGLQDALDDLLRSSRRRRR